MIARRLVVIHRGRTAGLLYRTPVTAFPYRDGFLIALTDGRDVDWVKNVIAEGGCRLIHRGRAVDLTGRGVLSLRQEDQAIPCWVRGILRLLRVDKVLHLRLGPFPERVRWSGAPRPGQVMENPVIAVGDRELSNNARDSQLEIGKTGAAVGPVAQDGVIPSSQARRSSVPPQNKGANRWPLLCWRPLCSTAPSRMGANW